MHVTIKLSTIAAFAAGLAAAMIAAFTFQAFRADAVGSDDATFVSITPCRLIDTRPAPDRVNVIGAFGIDSTRLVQAAGINGDCTIPADAVGLSLNVTAMGATAPTFLTIWPDGTRPKASSLNPAPGQPPTPNAVTTNLSGSGAFNVYNLAGTVNVIIDINGYYTKASLEALSAGATALEARVVELETILANVTRETVNGHPAIRFTGINVQLVDGTGTTGGMEAPNGLGNLIVGYDEIGMTGQKTGSHNLVVGYGNGYTGHGGFVAGLGNTVGDFASVLGGASNTASGDFATVSGGVGNTASGGVSSVSGGENNHASGFKASIAGGDSVTCGVVGVCGEGTLDPVD